MCPRVLFLKSNGCMLITRQTFFSFRHSLLRGGSNKVATESVLLKCMSFFSLQALCAEVESKKKELQEAVAEIEKMKDELRQSQLLLQGLFRFAALK